MLNAVMCRLFLCFRFFGSLYDDLSNLIGRSSLKSVADKLANIATALTKVSVVNDLSDSQATHCDSSLLNLLRALYVYQRRLGIGGLNDLNSLQLYIAVSRTQSLVTL